MASVKALIAEARKMSKAMVIDADGLHLVTLDPSIVEGYRDAILTPNEAEFQRLYTKVVGGVICHCIKSTEILHYNSLGLR